MQHETSYRMDYMRFVQHHAETGADVTIGCIPYDESRASDFGLMKIDGEVRFSAVGSPGCAMGSPVCMRVRDRCAGLLWMLLAACCCF